MEKDRLKCSTKHILLCGFPQVGKTTIGRQAAKFTQSFWADTDLLIQQKFPGSTFNFNHWVKKNTEPVFRKFEHQVLISTLLNPSPTIISLGGGTLLYPPSLKVAKEHLLCYIKPDKEVIRRRIRQHPFLEEFEQFYQDRLKHYESIQPDYTIHNVNELIGIYTYHYGK